MPLASLIAWANRVLESAAQQIFAALPIHLKSATIIDDWVEVHWEAHEVVQFTTPLRWPAHGAVRIQASTTWEVHEAVEKSAPLSWEAHKEVTLTKCLWTLTDRELREEEELVMILAGTLR